MARPRLSVGLAVALVAGTVAGGLFMWQSLRSPQARVASTDLRLPSTDSLVAGDLPTVAVSPDGRTVVYRARRDGVMRLFRRTPSRAEPEPVEGSESATAPFLSPEGRWIGFSRESTLYKVPVEGGPLVALCPAPGSVTAAWVDESTIVFGGAATYGLMSVQAQGGTPQRLTARDADARDEIHTLPSAMPDRRHVLFTILRAGRSELAVVPLAGGAHHVIAQGSQGRVVGRDSLVFVRDGALWAARLDTDRLIVDGPPQRMSELVEVSSTSGVAQFEIAAPGTLAYMPRRTDHSGQRRVVWLDQSGHREAVEVEPRPYTRAVPSPDGRDLALAVQGPGDHEVWLKVSATGGAPSEGPNTVPVTEPHGAGEFAGLRPRVSPNGRWLVYQSDESGRFEIYVRTYPKTSAGRWQMSSQGGTSPVWAPSGREIFYYRDATIVRVLIGDGDTLAVGPAERVVDVELPGSRLGPIFELSPDGRRFLVIESAAPSPDSTQLALVTHWDRVVEGRLAGR
jgi:eukaryotic-like serine/threonine-protein kinase